MFVVFALTIPIVSFLSLLLLIFFNTSLLELAAKVQKCRNSISKYDEN